MRPFDHFDQFLAGQFDQFLAGQFDQLLAGQFDQFLAGQFDQFLADQFDQFLKRASDRLGRAGQTCGERVAVTKPQRESHRLFAVPCRAGPGRAGRRGRRVAAHRRARADSPFEPRRSGGRRVAALRISKGRALSEAEGARRFGDRRGAALRRPKGRGSSEAEEADAEGAGAAGGAEEGLGHGHVGHPDLLQRCRIYVLIILYYIT